MTRQQQLHVLKKHPLLALYALGGINYARAKHFKDELDLNNCCFSMAYLYGVMRDLKPSRVVETGVRTGVSSAFILHALVDNGKGILYSIDLPNGTKYDAEMGLPRGTKTGFYVELFSEFKKRWQLIEGDARMELPKLLAKFDYIDAFHHDSDHSYSHMMFEFDCVWPKLRKGGLLLADDVDRNDAFTDFCKKVGVMSIITKDKGLAVK